MKTKLKKGFEVFSLVTLTLLGFLLFRNLVFERLVGEMVSRVFKKATTGITFF